MSYRHLIVIQKPSDTKSDGYPSGLFVDFIEVLARWKSVGGTETVDENQVGYMRSGWFQFRWVPGVTEDKRIKWKDGQTTRYFEILTVMDPGDIRYDLKVKVMEMREGYVR